MSLPQTGVKPFPVEGTERLVRRSIPYTIADKRKSVTLALQVNIMELSKGAALSAGYMISPRIHSLAWKSTADHNSNFPKNMAAARIIYWTVGAACDQPSFMTLRTLRKTESKLLGIARKFSILRLIQDP